MKRGASGAPPPLDADASVNSPPTNTGRGRGGWSFGLGSGYPVAPAGVDGLVAVGFTAKSRQ